MNMFCKYLLYLLLAETLHTRTRTVGQAQGLGLILQAPEATVAPLGITVTFTCRVVGNVFWAINLGQVQSEGQAEVYARVNISVPLSTPTQAEVTVSAIPENNGTQVQCLVEEPGKIEVLNRSEIVLLLLYGEPSPPSNLTLDVPSQGLGVSLSWVPGFALLGEEISFIIESTNIASGATTESRSNIPAAMLVPPSTGTCLYRFNVLSENDYSRSSTGVSEETSIPTVPTSLEMNAATITVSRQESLSATISFDDLSPCMNYSVASYLLMFSDVANPETNEFNISHPAGSSERVFVSVTANDGLLLGRQYSVTIIATNTVGSSASTITLYTSDLQSSLVVVDSFSANVTCIFVVGATAVGCQASFGSLLEVNISRNAGSNVTMESVALPDGLPSELTVTVAEILADGTTSAITFDHNVMVSARVTTNINTPPLEPTTTAANASSSSQVTIIPANSNSILSGSTLFIIIGAIAGVILLLLLVIIVVVCVIRSNYRRRSKNFHDLALASEEELKPNLVYGESGSLPHLAATTELGGLENARQARSNTYDNPIHEATPVANGERPLAAAIPMYETIEAAKKEMLNVGGPPVLNPVYGPSGTPKTPTSPHSQSASNPVYSTTGANSQPLSDISELNPMYAAIGKPAAQAVPVDVHYSNPYSQLPLKEPSASGSQPPPTDPQYSSPYSELQACVPAPSDGLPNLKRADSAGYPQPVLPMYEELRSVKRSDSLGVANEEVGEMMTRNESYGVIGMVEIGKSAKPLQHGMTQ